MAAASELTVDQLASYGDAAAQVHADVTGLLADPAFPGFKACVRSSPQVSSSLVAIEGPLQIDGEEIPLGVVLKPQYPGVPPYCRVVVPAEHPLRSGHPAVAASGVIRAQAVPVLRDWNSVPPQERTLRGLLRGVAAVCCAAAAGDGAAPPAAPAAPPAPAQNGGAHPEPGRGSPEGGETRAAESEPAEAAPPEGAPEGARAAEAAPPAQPTPPVQAAAGAPAAPEEAAPSGSSGDPAPPGAEGAPESRPAPAGAEEAAEISPAPAGAGEGAESHPAPAGAEEGAESPAAPDECQVLETDPELQAQLEQLEREEQLQRGAELWQQRAAGLQPHEEEQPAPQEGAAAEAPQRPEPESAPQPQPAEVPRAGSAVVDLDAPVTDEELRELEALAQAMADPAPPAAAAAPAEPAQPPEAPAEPSDAQAQQPPGPEPPQQPPEEQVRAAGEGAAAGRLPVEVQQGEQPEQGQLQQQEQEQARQQGQELQLQLQQGDQPAKRSPRRAAAPAPQHLRVFSPEKPEAEAAFELADGLYHHHMPVWTAPTGQCIYSDQVGRWAVGTTASMRSNAGWIISAAVHDRVRMPPEVGRAGGWQVFTGGGWQVCPATKVVETEGDAVDEAAHLPAGQAGSAQPAEQPAEPAAEQPASEAQSPTDAQPAAAGHAPPQTAETAPPEESQPSAAAPAPAPAAAAAAADSAAAAPAAAAAASPALAAADAAGAPGGAPTPAAGSPVAAGQPPHLWVASPDRPEVGGSYRLSEAVRRHGMPVWVGDHGRCIYSDQSGRWAVGNQEAMEANTGWVVSAEMHRNELPPSAIGGWVVYTSEGWRACPTTKVVDRDPGQQAPPHAPAAAEAAAPAASSPAATASPTPSPAAAPASAPSPAAAQQSPAASPEAAPAAPSAAENQPPAVLVVTFPDNPATQGEYALVRGEEWQGRPVWQQPSGQCIYSDAAGRWVMGTREVMRQNSGWVLSQAAVGGWPPAVRVWIAYDSATQQWAASDRITVTVGSGRGLALTPPPSSVLAAGCHSPPPQRVQSPDADAQWMQLGSGVSRLADEQAAWEALFGERAAVPPEEGSEAERDTLIAQLGQRLGRDVAMYKQGIDMQNSRTAALQGSLQGSRETITQLVAVLTERIEGFRRALPALEEATADAQSAVDTYERLGKEGATEEWSNMVEPADPLSAQALGVYAQDRALEDCLYALEDGLRRGVLDAEQYATCVQEIARRQFFQRALLNKIGSRTLGARQLSAQSDTSAAVSTLFGRQQSDLPGDDATEAEVASLIDEFSALDPGIVFDVWHNTGKSAARARERLRELC